MAIAATPDPSYYAVIFSSLRSDRNEGYRGTYSTRVALVERAYGFEQDGRKGQA
jgi:hypothetical protein